MQISKIFEYMCDYMSEYKYRNYLHNVHDSSIYCIFGNKTSKFYKKVSRTYYEIFIKIICNNFDNKCNEIDNYINYIFNTQNIKEQIIHFRNYKHLNNIYNKITTKVLYIVYCEYIKDVGMLRSIHKLYILGYNNVQFYGLHLLKKINEIFIAYPRYNKIKKLHIHDLNKLCKYKRKNKYDYKYEINKLK